MADLVRNIHEGLGLVTLAGTLAYLAEPDTKSW